MWPLVIVVLCVALMVGPVMLMQPSAKQKRLAALRQYAEAKGVRIQASKLLSPSEDLCWFYGCPIAKDLELPIMRLERKSYTHGLHVAGVWAVTAGSKEGAQSFEDDLKLLQEGVFGFEITAGAVGVHWDERGGEASVESWLPMLKRLATAN